MRVIILTVFLLSTVLEKIFFLNVCAQQTDSTNVVQSQDLNDSLDLNNAADNDSVKDLAAKGLSEENPLEYEDMDSITDTDDAAQVDLSLDDGSSENYPPVDTVSDVINTKPKAELETVSEKINVKPEAELNIVSDEINMNPEAELDNILDEINMNPEAELDNISDVVIMDPKADIDNISDAFIPDPKAEVENISDAIITDPKAEVENISDAIITDPKAEEENISDAIITDPKAELENISFIETSPIESTDEKPEQPPNTNDSNVDDEDLDSNYEVDDDSENEFMNDEEIHSNQNNNEDINPKHNNNEDTDLKNMNNVLQKNSNVQNSINIKPIENNVLQKNSNVENSINIKPMENNVPQPESRIYDRTISSHYQDNNEQQIDTDVPESIRKHLVTFQPYKPDVSCNELYDELRSDPEHITRAISFYNLIHELNIYGDKDKPNNRLNSEKNIIVAMADLHALTLEVHLNRYHSNGKRFFDFLSQMATCQLDEESGHTLLQRLVALGLSNALTSEFVAKFLVDNVMRPDGTVYKPLLALDKFQNTLVHLAVASGSQETYRLLSKFLVRREDHPEYPSFISWIISALRFRNNDQKRPLDLTYSAGFAGALKNMYRNFSNYLQRASTNNLNKQAPIQNNEQVPNSFAAGQFFKSNSDYLRNQEPQKMNYARNDISQTQNYV